MTQKIITTLCALALGSAARAQDVDYGARLFNDGEKTSSYLAWTFGGGYPLSAGTGIAGRHGGILGFGYEASVGLDIGGDYAHLAYMGLLKVYPFKGVFAGAGYGTTGLENITAYNHPDGTFSNGGYRQNSGILFMAGWDAVFGSVVGFQICGGAGYSLALQKLYPVVRLNFILGGSFN